MSFLSRTSLFLLMLFVASQFSCSRPEWEDFEGGVQLLVEVESKGESPLDRENTLKIKDILTKRIKNIGFKHWIIRVYGARQLVIQLPKSVHSTSIAKLSKSYFLEFKLVNEEDSLEEALKGNVPAGSEVLYQSVTDPNTGGQSEVPLLVNASASLTGENLKVAKADINAFSNEPCVQLEFDEDGTKLFEQVTAQNVGKRLAIVIDKRIYIAPVIQNKIPHGRAEIRVDTMAEARELALVLNSGAYPAVIQVIEVKELTKELWLGDAE